MFPQLGGFGVTVVGLPPIGGVVRAVLGAVLECRRVG